MVGKPEFHSRLGTSIKLVRQHQLETNSFCLCFFEDAMQRIHAPGSGLNLTDTMLLAAEWDEQDPNHLDRYLDLCQRQSSTDMERPTSRCEKECPRLRLSAYIAVSM